MELLETDYLVVGAGAAGMAFTDALVTHAPSADVVMVDRRHRPGGHWNDAYPFVRLHLPSAYYGVDSRPLGNDGIDEHGPNAGLYERASAAQICDYFGRVLDEQLLPSGRVRFYGMCEYDGAGGHRLRSHLTGKAYEVRVRRAFVDATYLESQVPATHTPTFKVVAGVRFVPVNELVQVADPPDRYVLIGGGKTSIDACLWLLDAGVEPDRIRWIRPQDPWLLDRAGWQPLDLVASIMDGLARELEALAEATSVDDLFLRLEACGRLIRIDEQVLPTAYRGGSVSRAELAQLRLVTDVVRLGRVLSIRPDEVVLEKGSAPAQASDLYVDCSAPGLNRAAARPIFGADRITLQQVRSGSPSFNAAMIGFLESTSRDTADKNRLCPPNPHMQSAVDWLSTTAISQTAAHAWRGEPDLSEWVGRSRLNFLSGVRDRLHEPQVQEAVVRYGQSVKPGLIRLHELIEGEQGA